MSELPQAPKHPHDKMSVGETFAALTLIALAIVALALVTISIFERQQ